MSVFDLQNAEIWINDMQRELETGEEERAYQALRAGLHALRDRLTVAEAAHLAAQLPMVIRGVFFEGWAPASRHDRPRTRESFLQAIERGLGRAQIDPELVARAVFRVLDKHVSQGQVANVRHSLPHQVAELWRAPVPLPSR